MNCPKCHSSISTDRCDECGWSKAKPAEQKPGPDWARIAADRERSIARVFEVYTGPRACQERTCMLRAVPGLEFCDKHAQLPESEVRRVGKIGNLRGKHGERNV